MRIMNIFVLDLDPQRCARYHCDSHVNKMLTESAQILSTVLGGPYKPTHEHHPCVKWTGYSIHNLAWLLALGEALGEEFAYRRGKKHASSLAIVQLREKLSLAHDLHNIQLPSHFALAMPDHLRLTGPIATPSVAVERYRAYYNHSKQGYWRLGKWVPAKWSKRDIPEWFEVQGEPSREVAPISEA